MQLEIPVDDARSRLIQGMAQVLAGKRYAELTIADVVAEAAVSRRTFYEHFDGKEACFIALYEAASQQCLQVLKAAVEPARGWQEQTRGALRAYLSTMDASPALTRTLLIEVLQLGPAGLAVRRRVHGEIAAFMRAIVNAGPPPQRLMSLPMAIAVVGGIHELVLQRVESGEAISGLVDTAAELLLRVAG